MSLASCESEAQYGVLIIDAIAAGSNGLVWAAGLGVHLGVNISSVGPPPPLAPS
jgi:hypothetical protein